MAPPGRASWSPWQDLLPYDFRYGEPAYADLPLVGKPESVDLDHHVTTKALDGLFYMIGQEEKKIRTDPAARVTELLKTVFGGR